MATITKLSGDDRTVLTLLCRKDGTEVYAAPVRERGIGFVGYRTQSGEWILDGWPVER